MTIKNLGNKVLAKKKQTKYRDPFAKREAENYENPIPSREFILDFLKEQGEPLDFDDIFNALHLSTEENAEALRRRLGAMCRDGQLMQSRRNKYGIIERMHLIRGVVQGHRDGHGFLIPDDGRKDLYIPAKEMQRVFDGDIILVRSAKRDYRGREVAAIVEILEHKHKQVVGRYFRESGVGFVEPSNQRIAQDILVPARNRKNAEHGQVVVVEIIEPPRRRAQAVGKIVEVLGDFMAPGLETKIAIEAHHIRFKWPRAVMQEEKRLPDQLQKKDYKNRKDLRELPFVTIDGEDAKDFDDAVYCEKRTRGGWRLYVAIADVSHYIKPKSELDIEAFERGNSVYFPGQVVPMLPEKISNGLCSLLPNVDRLVMVCEMQISAKGKMTKAIFYPAVIHSHARLTYTTVAEVVEYGQQQAREQWQALLQPLDELYALYHMLHAYRTKQGTLHFDMPEASFVFDEQRKIKALLATERNDAHKIIEECMLCANVAAAKFLLKSEWPGLYRVHPGPNMEKVADLKVFLNELGLSLGSNKEPTTTDYNQLLESVQDRPDSHIIQMVLLRSLQQAFYTAENAGHFGLGFDAYTHFTSPIRRYPDLLVHRTIKDILDDKKPTQKALEFYQKVAHHCSGTERKADDATREVTAWLKCEYMLDKLGEEFDGIVNSVTAFGLFIELRDNFVEGLVHITSLANDYYHYDEVHHRLIGEHTGVSYTIGDKLKVKVIRVSLDDMKIDFELVEQKRGRKSKSKRRGR